ncbi:CcmD family protein [Salinadaptatus halalkaliphilus]|uniref:CcmD family protein n=1 Tax=Salinadaptatus halalkaliphilus TaxID=2419781 RepID=A0A4S3TKR2_9EURY|nr:CcmD family protein [Salinadaptatus halalkaliphilus]THE64729.1 CcmD family protein [Salinadaptatus halalkaliphilus]
MEFLLPFAYGAIFLALVVYVLHLRSRLGELEQRLEDVATEQRTNSDD